MWEVERDNEKKNEREIVGDMYRDREIYTMNIEREILRYLESKEQNRNFRLINRQY